MQTTTLVQRNAHGRIKFITLSIDKHVVAREWGLIDGKTQTTENPYKTINAGKANELTPEQAAQEDYARIIKTKTDEGYVVVASLDDAETSLKKHEATVQALDFTCLPKEFCCSKPNQKLSAKKINKALAEGRGCVDHKYNGVCHFILCTPEGKIRIYTRRIDDHTAKYPKIAKDLEARQVLPPRSVIVTEFTIDSALQMGHMASFKRMSEVSRVDTLKGALKGDLTESWARQGVTPVKACVFGVLYWGGECVAQTMTYGEIRSKFIEPLPSEGDSAMIFKPTSVPLTKDSRIEDIKERLKDPALGERLEGYVAWMLDEHMEVSFNGKPKRRAAYKVLVPKEMDVVAYGYAEGTGDRTGKIGAFLIGLYNKDGDLVELGRVGSGIDDDEAVISDWELPCTIQIKYKDRFPTGKFQQPSFLKRHEDKQPALCLMG